MDHRSSAPSCGDLRRADETKAHQAGFVIGASTTAVRDVSLPIRRFCAVRQSPPGVLLGLRLSPMIAAGAIALSSLSVVGNAIRLCRYRVDQCLPPNRSRSNLTSKLVPPQANPSPATHDRCQQNRPHVPPQGTVATKASSMADHTCHHAAELDL